MKKNKFALILLVVIFCACKKNKTNTAIPQTHEVDASVTQFSCTDFYYYRVNSSTASSTEVDFGDGSPSLVLSSDVGYHQYTNIGNFILKIKQTFSDGQVVEKTFPINITQLCKFKRILSSNIPRTDFGTSNDIASFEFGGNVYFDTQIAFSGYRVVYNKASNKFLKLIIMVMVFQIYMMALIYIILLVVVVRFSPFGSTYLIQSLMVQATQYQFQLVFQNVIGTSKL